MPRYYFHIRSASGLEMDRQGVEFSDLDAAIADARQAGAEMLLDKALEETQARLQSTFEIADASGRIVAKVPFSSG